ncbi:DUF7519 family protein [Halorhabdus amylolytica]|uniref:DUF7519 family protein n=1 Tax=Halorhabdus amylolytica TaxID=2559573 RepID=UPI0010AA2628|nr:hypothetical protein [Halorhabdus amylolytica]
MIPETTPPRVAIATVGSASGISALALLLVPTAFAVAVVGAVVVVIGTLLGSRRVLGLGSLLQFGAVVAAGISSLSAGLVLVGLVAAVLAWDIGEQTIGVGEQLGTEAQTRRPIAVHAAASTLVGAIAIGGVYVTYLTVTGGQPLLALVLFLGGGAIVLLSMRT